MWPALCEASVMGRNGEAAGDGIDVVAYIAPRDAMVAGENRRALV